MVIKVYVSGISGNKEVKKRQMRVLMILESKSVDFQVIDITEPGKEAEKEYMQVNSSARDSKYPLPPQIFNDEDYCGDYEDFDMANEMDELEKFLKGVSFLPEENSENKSDKPQNGNASSREPSADKDGTDNNGLEDGLSEADNDQKQSESETKELSNDDLDLDDDQEKMDDDSEKIKEDDE
ncbi:SH3 domain-binding glutamic acid-rich protein homolog [Trichogramma pretiosum]|uniref:SH3 domain-binding glutamic acid-rich protein homolog n=1 Tax=Trichogramma pretiosum TaxID=7493 RepID=UPI0006C992E7|nr:SH3 domain-binding glutamic acid-rich protein homolog [Trichogramma pretiosum]